MAVFSSSGLRRGAAWMRRHVLLVGGLVVMVVAVAACVPTASAHEQEAGGQAAGHQHHAPDSQQRDGVTVVTGGVTVGDDEPADDTDDDVDSAVGPATDERQPRDREPGDQGTVIVNGLPTLGRDCGQSDLAQHHGFARAPRCVVTEMGEVPAVERGPQLLITSAPGRVGVGEPFTLRVSTRNLVRDRFLPAADGGYLLERADLTAEGLTRGHFHTACRSLSHGTDAAPDPAVRVDFFQATEDNGGGAAPDEVVVTVTEGIGRAGLAQCAAWAGDGSHRIPMMGGVQQIPAFDTVLLLVQ